MLSTSTIDQLRELPIETVIGAFITLKPAGSKKFKACCPFHDEKTPSFVVDPVKNTYTCYGCGAWGDGIAFVMEHEHLPFYEACKRLASDNGIAFEEKETIGKTPEQKKDETLMLEWIRKAQTKYRANLVERESVIRYLFNRNLTRETIIEWQFGLCHDWQIITNDLINAGHFKIGEQSGLVKSGNGRTWDFMHHRITIPIHDTQGKLIGFSGRMYATVDSYGKPIEGAKYMNPPESPLYEKSKLLFGLHKARKHFKTFGMAVLVEGYFDVIKMHQQGWPVAVASCGTALTEAQAKHLKRFTDTVLILRDGDRAGLNALKKDIPILLEQQFTVYICELPPKEDPDTLFDKPFERITQVLLNYCDGVEYLVSKLLAEGSISASGMASAIEKIVELLALITNGVRREQYIKSICAKYKGLNGSKLRETDFTKPLTKLFQQREEERLAAQEATQGDEYEALPKWVDRKQMELHGFVQLHKDTTGYKAGIYFAKDRLLYRVTNFTLKPLYHIFEQYNNRRLIEIDNGTHNRVAELPTNALSQQNTFEVELMHKGAYHCNELMGRKEYKRIMGWLIDNMPIAYELKTLGWQPEGFFAYSNAVFFDGHLQQYDELGMIKVADKHYMSLGNSKMRSEERQTDNPYENDLYLKYIPARNTITFEKWAKLFYDSYGVHAPFGMAFIFLTLYKDIVIQVAKMPLLYCYGQKGSGKSAMAESITWLFFSGKNSEGSLIQGFNLNPGQSTQFSLYNRLERFRNCPILMNEYDEAVIEPWKIGAMKAAYDGEGREVGVGESGKRKQTRIQKVQGTGILVGQYLGLRDDGAVASRSIPCNFSLERLKELTPDQIKSFNDLKREEREGLCFLLTDLLALRPDVEKLLAKEFAIQQHNIMQQMRNESKRIEARLISGYSLFVAITKVVIDLGIKLPYTFESFYEQAVTRMVNHNQLLKDNSLVGNFWKAVEVMFDKGIIQSGTHLEIKTFNKVIDIKEGSKVEKKEVNGEVLLLRFDNVYDEYAKYMRERTGHAVQNSKTVLGYLQEQTYYIGLHPVHSFSDKRTSAYAFNYADMQDMGIVLEKANFHKTEKPSVEQIEETVPLPDLGTQEDLPF